MRGRTGLLWMTIVAAPIALALETLIRTVLLPPEIEDVRWFLRPTLTVLVWALVGLTALLGALGVALQDRLAARAVARLPASRRTEEHEARARLGAFLLAASVPQVPAILATVGFTLGAELLPVLVAIGVSTLAVAVQAVRAARA